MSATLVIRHIDTDADGRLGWIERDLGTYVYTAPPPGEPPHHGRCVAYALRTQTGWEVRRVGHDHRVEARTRETAHARLRELVGAVDPSTPTVPA